MKRIAILSIVVVALLALSTGVAYANFGPHGGYTANTDACAGCHRAHSSFSGVTSSLSGNSALLVSSADSMSEFCYACHGDAAPGASTNVEKGLFDSGPSGSNGQAIGADNGGVAVAYVTSSTAGAVLNGGGFDSLTGLTSMHDMDKDGATDPMWGAGNSAPGGVNLTCTDCHDPHGSSNYRLLRDKVNNVMVGGYADAAGQDPRPYVVSFEKNYPTVGWKRGAAGNATTVGYVPNYTAPMYASFGVSVDDGSMSQWCSACHTQYNVGTSEYDYGTAETAANVAVTVGSKTRHRHPVDMPASAGDSFLALPTQTHSDLPLEQVLGTSDPASWNRDDFVGCLTCHRAHGTAQTMSGWANAELILSDVNNTPGNTADDLWMPQMRAQDINGADGFDNGVNPNFSSALLRLPNRGVCEGCHAK